MIIVVLALTGKYSSRVQAPTIRSSLDNFAFRFATIETKPKSKNPSKNNTNVSNQTNKNIK